MRLHGVVIITSILLGAACAKKSNPGASEPSSWEPDGVLAGWHAFEAIDDDMRRCASYAAKDRQWRVDVSDGIMRVPPLTSVDHLAPANEPKVNPRIEKGVRGKRVAVKMPGGVLVGYDGGEWGGDLRWGSDDGSNLRVLLKENVVGIVRISPRLLVLTGTHHMKTNRGSIFEIRTTGAAEVGVEPLVELDGKPEAFAVARDGVLLLTTGHGIYQLRDDKIDRLREEDLSLLYPNSIVARDDGIYVGMRLFILRLSPLGRHVRFVKWLVPPGCSRMRVVGHSCVCS